jgi:hypothetical protein
MPATLEGRDLELAQLAAFCTALDSDSYMWWRGPAWAGKSALMSWFTLHPPQRVRIVPFFITSRWDGQSDRIAFTDVVIDQFAELLNEPVPTHLTAATRDGHFLDLMERAAHACANNGERLVLLVDGLDEDRGVTSGPNAHSIAALLPEMPTAGMRVIVAGRLNPPIPTDVPDHHPLRTSVIVQELESSPAAAVIREDMTRELDGLLMGSQAERDLVGMIATAAGGLSAQDLAELTGLSQHQVEKQLTTVAGRSFVPRPSAWRPGISPDVYILGHEELQRTAANQIGTSGEEAYRRGLHDWAGIYRDRSWPAETPEYLLRGYFQLLRRTGDLPGMLMCATDSFRQARMLAVTGGDNAALAEIAAAQEAFLAGQSPDITAAARLAVHHAWLSQRNTELPTGIPAVWARLGDISRARQLADSFASPMRRTTELLAAASVLHGMGDRGQAKALIDDVLGHGRAIDDPSLKAALLAYIAGTVAKVATAADARVIVLEAHAAAEEVAATFQRDTVIVDVVTAAAECGDSTLVQSLIQKISEPKMRVAALVRAAEVLAQAYGLARSEEFLSQINHPIQRAWTFGNIMRALVAGGHLDEVDTFANRVEKVAGSITDPAWRANTLGVTAYALAAAGSKIRARRIIRQVRAIEAKRKVRFSVVLLAEAYAALGEFDEALSLARRTSDPEGRARVALELARAGKLENAQAVADEIVDTIQGRQLLTNFGRMAADADDAERAIFLISQATPPIQLTPARLAGDGGASTLVSALAGAGYIGEALEAASWIDQPEARDQAILALIRSADYRHHESVLAIARSSLRQVQAGLAAVSMTAALAGDELLATTLAKEIRGSYLSYESYSQATQALIICGHFTPGRKVYDSSGRYILLRRPESIYFDAAIAVLRVGRYADAERIANAIFDGDVRDLALAHIAEAAVVANDSAKASAIARSITSDRPETAMIVTHTFALLGDRKRARKAAADAELGARRVGAPSFMPREFRHAARAAAFVGEFDHACSLIKEGEVAARKVRKAERANAEADIKGAISDLALVAAAAGETSRARTLAERISDQNRQARLFIAITRELATSGYHKEATALARSIRDPVNQAEALATVAKIIGGKQALILIGEAIQLGGWEPCLMALVKVASTAVAAIAHEIAASGGRTAEQH